MKSKLMGKHTKKKKIKLANAKVVHANSRSRRRLRKWVVLGCVERSRNIEGYYTRLRGWCSPATDFCFYILISDKFNVFTAETKWKKVLSKLAFCLVVADFWICKVGFVLRYRPKSGMVCGSPCHS
jgi:hypothetical protein